ESTDVKNGEQLNNIATSRCKYELKPASGNVNYSQVGITVSKNVSLSRSKLPVNTYVDAGSTYNWTINVGNNSASALQNQVVIDVLPYSGDGMGTILGDEDCKIYITGWKINTDTAWLTNLSSWEVYYTDDPNVRTASASALTADAIRSGTTGVEFIKIDTPFSYNDANNTAELNPPRENFNPVALVMVGELPGNQTLHIDVEFTLSNPMPGDVLANQLDGYPSRIYTVKRSLRGVTWLDGDIDGVRQDDETMLDGVKVTLYKLRENGDPTVEEDYEPYYDANGYAMTVFTGYQKDAATGETTAFNEGEYNFTGLDAGTYAVKFTSGDVKLVNYMATAVDGGSDDTVDSDGIPTYDGNNLLQKTVILGIVMEPASNTMANIDQISANHDSGFYALSPMNIVVAKQVQGNMGDKYRSFDFKVTFTDENDISFAQGTQITLTGSTLSGIDVAAPEDTVLTLDDTGSAAFSLMHGQTYTLTGMDGTDKVRIVETGLDGEGYETSITIYDGSDTTDITGSDTGVYYLNPAMRDYQFTYTNAREVPVPTGISVDVLPWMAIMLLATGGWLALMISNRKYTGLKGKRDA
ncbi:MAG: SdrD B-like domain-containing protein, partial [Clostridia bacterium]|nr:SdrD B-like domain-containing protein [Clostridia bacterium]